MKIFCCILFALLLSACSGGGGGDNPPQNNPPPPAQPTFIEQTQQLAGEDALDCGELAIGAAPTEINSCVADAFHTYQPFYAIYNLQGIDSNVATGYAYDSMNLYFVPFDDFSCTTPGNCDSYYRVLECVSPQVNDPGSQEALNGNPFDCSDWVEVM